MLHDIFIVKNFTQKAASLVFISKYEIRDNLNKGLPIVSLSIGDGTEFLYGDESDVDKAEKVNSESRDVLIFGGKSRHEFMVWFVICTMVASNMHYGRLNLILDNIESVIRLWFVTMFVFGVYGYKWVDFGLF